MVLGYTRPPAMDTEKVLIHSYQLLFPRYCHLNYSKENQNKEVFAKYGFPQRFGFPVFIILDGKGNRIHTQASEYFENGKKSYDAEKVLNFLQQWSPTALDPKLYSK